jgi:SAM-dependent methyltransferase
MGIDLSPHMLEQARDPIDREALDIDAIELRCGDICALELSDQSFDLIYSIGVVAEYPLLDDVLLSRLFQLLKPGGKLFFTAVDIYSRLKIATNTPITLTRRALRRCFPLLPSFAKKSLNRALSSHYVTERELTALLAGSPFSDFTIARYQHRSGWQGTHLDCLAQRGAA